MVEENSVEKTPNRRPRWVSRRGERGQTTSEISYLVQRFIVGETVNEGPLIDEHFRTRTCDQGAAF